MSNGIYFLMRTTVLPYTECLSEGMSYALQFFSFETRRVEQLFTGQGTAEYLAVSPAQDWAYFSIPSRSEQDLMLVENFR